MAAHYVWIVRIDAAFEETAAEAGIELQEITTAFKEGRLGVLQASKDKRIPPRRKPGARRGSKDDESAPISSGTRVNATQPEQSVFVRVIDASDDAVCADSTLMVPKLGQCNYRDLVFDSNVAERLVS